MWGRQWSSVAVTRYYSSWKGTVTVAPSPASRAPPAARRNGEFNGSSGGQSRPRIAHPTELFDLTMSRDGVADPRWVVQEQGGFNGLEPCQFHMGHPFV